MAKKSLPQDAGDQEIISERRLYRDFPVTQDDVEDGIETGDLNPIPSASGGRFFYVAEVEAFTAALSEEEDEVLPRSRSSGRNPSDEDPGEGSEDAA